MTSAVGPKVFFSYSWTSPEHEEWVLALGTRLRANGVDAIIDKWKLREGQDAHAFMESMVTDPSMTKVAVICDRVYAEKADDRSGGVGTESQIMSGEIYGKVDQTKFVAIATEKDDVGKAYLPTFFKSRIYIDLSPTADYDAGIEQILRWCFNKPLYVEPELGAAPIFDDANLSPVIATATGVAIVAQARNTTPQNMMAATRRFFTALGNNMGAVTSDFESQQHADDVVVTGIEAFCPVFKQIFQVVDESLPFDEHGEVNDLVHGYLESLVSRFDAGRTSWSGDLAKFVAHFVLVYFVKTLIDNKRYLDVSSFLDNPFVLVRQNEFTAKSTGYRDLRPYLESLDARNTRLGLRQFSLHADFIKQACERTGLSFNLFMQADFVLYLRSILVDRANEFGVWYPISLVYGASGYGAFPVFVRAENPATRSAILQMVGLSDFDQATALRAATADQSRAIKFSYRSLPSVSLANLDILFPLNK